MEGSENILGNIYEEETLEDVDMLDVGSVEEGEIEDDKQCIESIEDNKGLNQEAHSGNPRPKFKRKKNKRKRKPNSVSTITDINRFVLDTCRRLREKKSYLIWNAVGCLGVAAVGDLVKEVDAIQACGGQMTADGKRSRNGGGVLWNILKTREPRAYKEIMTKGKELEKQIRKPNTRQGPMQAKTILASERIAHAPSDQIVDQASDGSQYTSQVQDELEPSYDHGRHLSAVNRLPILDQASDGSQYTSHVQDELEPSYDHGRRVSALDRLRVPVAYDDLL